MALIDNADGSVTRTGLPEPARKALGIFDGPALFPRVPGDTPEHMVPPFLVNGAKPHTLAQSLRLPAPRQMLLPTDPAVRKAMPITKGVLDYFPLALAEVARVSKAGNDQHNPGEPLHWDKTKSMDHADCIARHLIDRGTFDPTDSPPQRHSAKLAWRALALLQLELEAEASS